MFKFEMKGFDKVQRHLDDMAKRAAELDGKQQAESLSELLNDDFIAEHSSFLRSTNCLLQVLSKSKLKKILKQSPTPSGTPTSQPTHRLTPGRRCSARQRASI